MSGLMSYCAGAAAEDIVAQRYLHAGMTLCAQRWRGRGGEIDLIFEDGDEFVFVEVKKSASHQRAAERLSRRQVGRIMRTAVEYAANRTGRADNNMRFDLATMDQVGSVEIVPNAMQFA